MFRVSNNVLHIDLQLFYKSKSYNESMFYRTERMKVFCLSNIDDV